MTINSEFDYSLNEIKNMKWYSSNSYENNKKIHILHDFDANTHIAYNEVKIEQVRINKGYGFIETEFYLSINADYYGEKGLSKKFVLTNLRDVKKEAMEIIEEAYHNKKWCLKKTNLI